MDTITTKMKELATALTNEFNTNQRRVSFSTQNLISTLLNEVRQREILDVAETIFTLYDASGNVYLSNTIDVLAQSVNINSISLDNNNVIMSGYRVEPNDYELITTAVNARNPGFGGMYGGPGTGFGGPLGSYGFQAPIPNYQRSHPVFRNKHRVNPPQRTLPTPNEITERTIDKSTKPKVVPEYIEAEIEIDVIPETKPITKTVKKNESSLLAKLMK